MTIMLRAGRPEDAPECGRICHAAFAAIARAHGYAPDFPDVAAGVGVTGMMLGHPLFYSVVAERDGVVVGSNFLDERNPIAGVGPVTVDPDVQNLGIGVRLMHDVMARADARGFAGIRLVQAGYHTRSLALYSKLGFEVREHLSCLQSPAIHEALAGYTVRAATEADLAQCNALCTRIHGAARGGELRDAVLRGVASVVERNSRLTGYATEIALFGHAVGETTNDVKALIGAAREFGGPGFLLPSRNGELLRWCLARKLRLTQSMTLMTRGLYDEPAGAYLVSVTY